jgi:ferrous iron transport protein B
MMEQSVRRIALIGNPNTGKTSLFNRLCGARTRTANFPGSTAEARRGTCWRGDRSIELIDLPGIYALDLDLPESLLCHDCLEGRVAAGAPDAVLLVLDATNLRRSLQLAASVLALGRPVVVALNMVDLAARRGLSLSTDSLSRALGCPVRAVSARSGEGVDELIAALELAVPGQRELPSPRRGDAASIAATAAWAEEVLRDAAGGEHPPALAEDTLTDRLDRVFTHPILGLAVFMAVMTLLFATIFWLADVPMGLIEGLFAWMAAEVEARLPAGALTNLLAHGVIAGVGGVVIFLPQICLLFFLLTLLEDTGYLARAAFVMDRLLRRFGLPGQAFVPLLSSHACALPGIMSARLIPDRHERLATILVAPFMSCSARIPVYVLMLGLLFADRPIVAGLAFVGCYALGAGAALLTALLFRRTLLRGRSRPMVMELPSYKRPLLRTALMTTLDRARLFLRNAGSVILAIGIIMWWLSAYPQSPPPPEAEAMMAQAVHLPHAEAALALRAEAQTLTRRTQQLNSFAGRLGVVFQPLFAPLGADRQITVAILTSFLAREVFQGTMIILVGMDEDAESDRILGAMRSARRDDGAPLFDAATTAGVLIFYVLAMQCLPTLALTRRETGSWKWAALQFGWMSALAWIAGAIAFALVRLAVGAA